MAFLAAGWASDSAFGLGCLMAINAFLHDCFFLQGSGGDGLFNRASFLSEELVAGIAVFFQGILMLLVVESHISHRAAFQYHGFCPVISGECRAGKS